ncbi:MAG: hypothetical protein OEU56_25840 [Rhodospirillales bacterium]|nr:hypothetical protein [Rhodospirillales bacterium]
MQTKLPVMWQARMRNDSMTGRLAASESSKACSVSSTTVAISARGSISGIEDFRAVAWVRS